MITISAFAWVPPFARGQVRDLRVRWALEEAGLRYRTRLLEQGDQDSDEYRALQPFGQVPVFQEDGLTLFETGAIVHHIGQRSENLLPADPAARPRALQWMFAALNSVEPHVQALGSIDAFYAGEEWAKLRRQSALEFMQRKVAGVARALGDQPFLDGDRFTAGDLIMATVLGIHPQATEGQARLAAYVERCRARPAFSRAMAAHLADFRPEQTAA